MNNYQKEQAFKNKKAQMTKKYSGNINSFCKVHGVEKHIGWDMLFFNARCFANGVKNEVIPGGGTINVPALVADYKELEQFIVWQG